MVKYILLFAMLVCCAGLAVAQDNEGWIEGEGSLEYNCTNLQQMLDAIKAGETAAVDDLGALALVRDGSDETTIETYIGGVVLASLADDPLALLTPEQVFANPIAACAGAPVVEEGGSSTASVDTFNVIVNGNVNLRSCAGTNCDVVGRANDGSLLKVTGEDGDWYEVQLDDGSTAFIASRLTTRGPDAIIPTDEAYADLRTGCFIVFDIKRGDMTMDIVLAGDNRGEVVVDLTRPRDTKPLVVDSQLDKEFIDTGEPYIHQFYRWNVRFPLGVYQLDITFDGKTSKLAWEAEVEGDYTIFVQCE